MNLAKISIKNPVLVVSVMLALVFVGISSFRQMSIDMFPSVSVPVISVTTIYPGAGSAEIETLISRPLEDQISSISGLKRLNSRSLEGVSIIIAEFNSSVDVGQVEQEVRDKVNLTKTNLPSEVKEPLIRRFDPSDQPVITLALTADMKPAELFDFADRVIKPRIEQVKSVGAVEIYGGRKREIHVLLDRKLLADKELSVSQVAGRIGASGENIPSGKISLGEKEISFRGLGEFENIDQIGEILINLYGNEVPTKLSSIGRVADSLEDEKNRTYIDGKPAIFLYVYRQSGTNIIDVADGVKTMTASINKELNGHAQTAKLTPMIDSSNVIRYNVYDVYETIIIAIILTVITVFFFLGSFRTTLITALSLPISLIGSFIAMQISGFSLNILSLLALSLGVGLLVDDAIVVIENIYRRIQLGEDNKTAAEKGTAEIQLSVFSITLVVISVFLPVGFMSGTIGQFLKQFGLTIVYSMAISLFVSLTLIPMLSAYFADSQHGAHGKGPIQKMLSVFDRFQTWLEHVYGSSLKWILKHPMVALLGSILVFAMGLVIAQKVPSSFIPEMDNGEIVITLEMQPGTSLDGMQSTGQEIEKRVRQHSNIDMTALTVGGKNSEANKAEIFIRLKKGKERGGTTSHFKETLRNDLVDFGFAKPVVKDFDFTGGIVNQPLIFNLRGSNPQELEAYAAGLMKFLEKDPRVKDAESTHRTGKPEFRVKLDNKAANTYGINSKTMGVELRGQVEGFTPAKFRQDGREYDIRVRLQSDQRNLKASYNQILVPNVNYRLVRLSDIAKGEEVLGAAEINRQDRGRHIQITAGLAPGAGLSSVVKDVEAYLKNPETALPSSMTYNWAGDTENMNELSNSSLSAIGFAVLFIYLILASLYGSFVTPITIMVALPLALSGAFYALFIAQETMSIFAVLGIFLLLGVAGKNSILLVDFANHEIQNGKSRNDAILAAGVARLRPILMTSFALIAGTIPVAIGLNEASAMRTAMGWAVIGGVTSSTLLTLIVVPAIFSYVDRYRVWSKDLMARIFLPQK